MRSWLGLGLVLTASTAHASASAQLTVDGDACSREVVIASTHLRRCSATIDSAHPVRPRRSTSSSPPTMRACMRASIPATGRRSASFSGASCEAVATSPAIAIALALEVPPKPTPMVDPEAPPAVVHVRPTPQRSLGGLALGVTTSVGASGEGLLARGAIGAAVRHANRSLGFEVRASMPAGYAIGDMGHVAIDRASIPRSRRACIARASRPAPSSMQASCGAPARRSSRRARCRPWRSRWVGGSTWEPERVGPRAPAAAVRARCPDYPDPVRGQRRDGVGEPVAGGVDWNRRRRAISVTKPARVAQYIR